MQYLTMNTEDRKNDESQTRHTSNCGICGSPSIVLLFKNLPRLIMTRFENRYYSYTKPYVQNRQFQHMVFGKTIKIFLIDGDPNGRMSCELSNWSGKAFKMPGITIKDCTDRDYLTSKGVYILFGKDDDGKDLV